MFSPDRFLAFSSILHLGRLRGGQGFVLARVFWLVARLNGMCPAVIAAFHFMLFWPPARRAGVRACSCIRACRSIERYVPCGHEGFSFSAVLAASGGGRWGPVRGSIDAFWPLAQGVTFTLRMRRVSSSLSASHAGRKRTLALRGAEGDRRAKRGSSRSVGRAALAERRRMESLYGLVRGSGKTRQAQRGRPGGVQRGPRRGGSP